MKCRKLIPLFLIVLCFSFLNSCSSDEGSVDENTIVNDDDDVGGDDDNTDDNTDTDNDNSDDSNTADLEARFSFDRNLVIENSYNTGGCESPPCDTIDEDLDNVFVNDVPDDNYFSLSEDQSELILECQLEEGRRIEFKQVSEGPLDSFSKIELEGIYEDIPRSGVTIAQVHNRGGTGNKPFFRLVLYENRLETVLRRDPEVSSEDTRFTKVDIPFSDGGNYDGSSLKIDLEKSNNAVHIIVEQNGEVILNQSFVPYPNTRWLTDEGISNGYYLKAGMYNDAGTHSKNLVARFSTVKFQSDDQR